MMFLKDANMMTQGIFPILQFRRFDGEQKSL